MAISLDRIAALAEQVGSFAGRRMDALAKTDPVLEMARIHVDDLRWRMRRMLLDMDERTRSTMTIDDIETALSRMSKVLGGAAGTAALLPAGAARHQIRSVVLWLDDMAADLEARAAAGISAADALRTLGAVSRAMCSRASSNVYVVAVLANSVEVAVRLSRGQLMQAGPDRWSPLAPIDQELCVAIGLEAHWLGVTTLALHLFAEVFPEHAARLDRQHLDRIARATTIERNGAQYGTAAHIAKLRFGIHVAGDSVPREIKRLRRAQFGQPTPAQAH